MESVPPDSLLFDGITTPVETAAPSTTATSSQACSLPQELGQEPLNASITVQQPSPSEDGVGNCPISVEACAGL